MIRLTRASDGGTSSSAGRLRRAPTWNATRRLEPLDFQPVPLRRILPARRASSSAAGRHTRERERTGRAARRDTPSPGRRGRLERTVRSGMAAAMGKPAVVGRARAPGGASRGGWRSATPPTTARRVVHLRARASSTFRGRAAEPRVDDSDVVLARAVRAEARATSQERGGSRVITSAKKNFMPGGASEDSSIPRKSVSGYTGAGEFEPINKPKPRLGEIRRGPMDSDDVVDIDVFESFAESEATVQEATLQAVVEDDWPRLTGEAIAGGVAGVARVRPHEVGHRRAVAQRHPRRVDRSVALRREALRESGSAVDVRDGVASREPSDSHRSMQRSVAHGAARRGFSRGRRSARDRSRGGGTVDRGSRESEALASTDCVVASISNRRRRAPRRRAGDVEARRQQLLARVPGRHDPDIRPADDLAPETSG